MTKVYIKDFEEGLRINESLLIVNVTKGLTNAGATYLNIEFQDNTGTIDAKLWDANEENIAIAAIGSVIQVNGDVLLYRNNLQLRINKISSLAQSEYEITDYLKASPIERPVLEDEIYSFIEQIDNENLFAITNKIVRENANDYFTYPAASRIHHEFVGGLATHVLGMLKIAETLVNLYPLINKSLLYSGIVLHDFGKTTELSGPILTQYTTAGKLLGHISIMQADLLDYAKQLGIEDSEEIMLLRHLILSHHGEYEYGSPVLPLVTEAELLTFIDNMDARINMLEKAMDNIDAGEFTPRIFSLENRAFYKHKL
ncbi:MAG: HD domain-containing protein [Erysipelothrix sp.]|nr:HD domain-containing protein [Erysipelothrix sp.]